MSYSVRFEVYWEGEGLDQFENKARRRVFARVEEFLRGEEGRAGCLATYGTADYGAEWLEEFRKAFDGPGGEIKGLERRWAAGLLRRVSADFPGAIFGARGVGEELDDVWVFWYRDGRRVKSPAKEEG